MTSPDFLDLQAERRLAEAAAWRAQLADLDLESVPEFEVWLASDPANAEAWRLAESVWNEIGDSAAAPELMAIRRRAMSLAEQQGRRNRGDARWAGPKTVSVIAMIVLSVGGIGLLWHLAQPQIFQTQLGERRVVPLADGSKVTLDSNSEVAVRYTADARKLTLLRGQARFDVAHDVQRPFSVTARDETVVATGTAFDIDLMGPKTIVTLIEGHVVVLALQRSGSATSRSMRRDRNVIALTSGQQLTGGDAATPVVATVSLERATAWEVGRLIFSDDQLSVVVERMSRYTPSPIMVDPTLADVKISGIFNAGDIDGFIEAITHYLPIDAQRKADGAIVLIPRHAHS